MKAGRRSGGLVIVDPERIIVARFFVSPRRIYRNDDALPSLKTGYSRRWGKW